MSDKNKEELEAYLRKIRKTISESNNLISQAELRMAETDRALEEQGLTREQVRNLHFSKEQLEAVNRELERLGFPPIEEEELPPARMTVREAIAGGHVAEANLDVSDTQGDVENRRRKFNAMMGNFRI